MVLHNNKWDKRAKAKYMKKHGLSKQPASESNNEVGAHFDDKKQAEDKQLSPEPSQKPGVGEDAVGVSNGVAALDISGSGVDLPEFDDDEDEMKALRLRSLKTQEVKNNKPSVEASAEKAALFKRAELGSARSQLNEQVAKIGRKYGKAEVDSDSDFDNFMDELSEDDESPPPVSYKTPAKSMPEHKPLSERFKEQDAFLDKILK